MRVDQLLPTFGPQDAIGNHALQVRKALRAAGFDADIWADATHGGGGRDARPWADIGRVAPGETVLLYHASTDTARLPWLIEQAAAGVTVQVDYHNITPAPYFDRWLPDAARGMRQARQQLAALAPSARLALADSQFNEGELVDAGYAPTATRYLLVDLESYHREPDRKVLERRRRERRGPRWLFVGRLAPNKCQHDVIAAFAAYRAVVDPTATLTLVGGGTAPRYVRALHAMIGELDLGASVELLDSIDLPALLAIYRSADVFVCLSEHEGFCVPVLEAMELGVPVVAYAAAALPETLADAGMLLAGKDPLRVALAVEGILTDAARRAEMVAAGRQRAARFALARTAAEFVGAVSDHLT